MGANVKSFAFTKCAAEIKSKKQRSKNKNIPKLSGALLKINRVEPLSAVDWQ